MTLSTLNERLVALPPKTYHALAALIAAGQIDTPLLEILLDAAALSGDDQRLLGFATGYLHMTRAGVPVEDVIRMAKSQHRQINLAWSPARWNDEHNKLSRAETLARLSMTNESYDLSSYDAHLPEAARKTLIRCSKRLGLEGLRQRHCVASYHDRVLKGECAIASVIAGHRRWTVQLERTGFPDRPLAITQIKTRLNGAATPEIRRMIHDSLGVAPPVDSNVPPPTLSARYLDNLRRVLPILEARAVESVSITFSGSGDTGAIDWIFLSPQQSDDFMEITLDQLRTNSFFEDNRWQKSVVPETMTLKDALHNITDDYLEETGVNWYDNDGGYGELVINVSARSVSLDINVNHTESINEFWQTMRIDTGDIED